MKLEYDAAKNAWNIARRGLSFDLVARFDWDTAVVLADHRWYDGEARYQAFGSIDRRLYFLAFTLRGDALRVISLRKANSREVRLHEQKTRSGAR